MAALTMATASTTGTITPAMELESVVATEGEEGVLVVAMG